ncbi:hypothetical protein JS533_009060 [Bifidobacterium amazonense]|uniref:Uncharacterized protein n=1 Tax=Bifidobacterium amazonense TaxID=2809027 RepID=A0ABS9VWC9_9BIFI|nr:hypothetical protein [Bifidobacterium amazonense]MCH9276413.1 hypothetical protein [Bifidobacterium amazonense]
MNDNNDAERRSVYENAYRRELDQSMRDVETAYETEVSRLIAEGWDADAAKNEAREAVRPMREQAEQAAEREGREAVADFDRWN